jgi:hypothetical protein
MNTERKETVDGSGAQIYLTFPSVSSVSSVVTFFFMPKSASPTYWA